MPFRHYAGIAFGRPEMEVYGAGFGSGEFQQHLLCMAATGLKIRKLIAAE